MARLLAAGITVLVPWGDNSRYDLVAQVDMAFLRLQCKTGRLRNGRITFLTCGVGRDGNRYRYQPGEIDYYAICCLETGGVYLVPYSEAGPSAEPYLRVDPPKPGSTGGRQMARIRWAARYAADRVIDGWVRTGGHFAPLDWSVPILTNAESVDNGPNVGRQRV